MAKRHKNELADIRARFSEPTDPETEVELARLRLSLAREMLLEYESGTHGYANQVEMTAGLIELTRQDIIRFEAIIAAHEVK